MVLQFKAKSYLDAILVARSDSSLGLTDDGLGVVAGNVVELDAVAVEVVEDGKAELVALTVVGLGALGSGMLNKMTTLRQNYVMFFSGNVKEFILMPVKGKKVKST